MHRALLVIALSWLVSAGARADVPPPGAEECNGRAVGDACVVDGTDGACVDSTCGRLDYSTMPPQSVSYPCVVCQAGATPTSPPATTGGCAVAPAGSAGVGWLAGVLLACLALRRRRAPGRR